MKSKWAAGALAGAGGGAVCGLIMNLVREPGGRSLVAAIGGIVGVPDPLAGWALVLLSAAGAGILFALLLGRRVHSPLNGMLWGAVYGTVWWFVGGLVLLPLLLGWGALGTVVRVDQTIALGQLAGHAAYGLSLGWGFGALCPPRAAARRRDETRLRTAA